MATPGEAVLLSEQFGGGLSDGRCETCYADVAVWEIGDGLYCSAECALRGLPESEWTNFEEYLADLRLKASVLAIFDSADREP